MRHRQPDRCDLDGSYSLRKIVVFAIVLLGAAVAAGLAAPAPAHAQQSRGPLVLLTEERVGADGELAAGFWWSAREAPQWTATDMALMEAGVAIHRPDDLGSISRIYRRANLSDANAIALAGLFGRGEAVVGTVRVEPVIGAPIGLQGVQVSIDARAVKASEEGARVGERLSVRRAAFGASLEEAANSATRAASQALARRLEARARRGDGDIGVSAGEPLIGIRDARTGLVLEAIHDYLRGLQGVDEVKTRWAASGVVALELNPGVADPPEQVRRWASALESQLFESFSAHRGPEGGTDLIELQIRHAETSTP